MPPPSAHPCLDLALLPGNYFVLKLNPDEPIPDYAQRAMISQPAKGMFSLTRTEEETSIVGEAVDGMPDEVGNLATWRCLKIKGPMEFDLVGVLASFTEPLMKAEIGVFAISTWNTDFILVPKEKAELAVKALKKDGWKFPAESD